MLEYKEIAMKQEDLSSEMSVREATLEKLDVKVIAHFGNIPTVVMLTEYGNIFPEYNMMGVVSKVLQIVLESLELDREDGVLLSDIKNTPIKVVIKDGKVVGFGHPRKDRFLLFESIMHFVVV